MSVPARSVPLLRAASLPLSYVPRSGPIVRRLAPKTGPVARQRFRGGAVLDLDLSDRIQAEAFVRRAYQHELCRWLSKRLGPGDLFVDVGAHVGMLTFSVVQTGARVVAFEPDPKNAARWRANRALNPSVDATLVQAAVGAHPGTVRFCVGREPGWGHVGEGELEVTQVTLDDQCPDQRIAVLKVDTQGFDPDVVRGATRLLTERRVGALICEVRGGFESQRETVRLLRDLGYNEEPIARADSVFRPG